MTKHGEFEGGGCGGDERRDQDIAAIERIRAADEHIRYEWDEASGDVAGGNSKGGAAGATGGGLFQAQLEAHHEIDVGGVVLLQGGEHRRGGLAGDGILVEDLVDLLGLVVGAGDDFLLLAGEFGGVVFGVAPGGQISAEAHGDRAGGDLG